VSVIGPAAPGVRPPPKAVGETLPGRALETEAALRAEIERLAGELQAKSDLLKELNHRAKNSLQMAMAVLSMQAQASDDGRVVAALQEASERLGYLARVHELLYQRGDDIQEIEIGGFLRDIGSALQGAFKNGRVRLTYDIHPVMLDVSRAISVALIVGEAVLNSYKYAFPGGAGGTIGILCKPADGAIAIAIRDDGVGFSAEERRGSLGMRLLRALGRSLGGETLVTSGAGTTVSLTFPATAAQPDG
jgi:two-component sensor histidine kinase